MRALPPRLARPVHRLLPVLLVSLFAACGTDAVAPAPPAERPPLVTATWHVHEAEGQTLPALVAHRLEAGTLVQDFLDSARVEVRAEGTWTRALWLSQYRDGAVAGTRAELEHGTWRAADSLYAFVAEPSGRVFTVAQLTPGREARVPLRGLRDGFIEGLVRTEPPPAPLTGTYRATAVRGVSLPAPIQVFHDHEEDGRLLSIHLIVDSVRLVLQGNHRYAQVLHYTEWEGPNRGAPTRVRFRWRLADFGQWTRTGSAVRFESGWLQHHRFAGLVEPAGALALEHGLSHGDEPAPVRYTRDAVSEPE
jgi:hypothetical protein